MNVLEDVSQKQGLNNNIVKYEAKKLDENSCDSLPKFASDGSDNEPDSLKVMLAALDRHLRQNDSKIFIAKD